MILPAWLHRATCRWLCSRRFFYEVTESHETDFPGEYETTLLCHCCGRRFTETEQRIPVSVAKACHDVRETRHTDPGPAVEP